MLTLFDYIDKIFRIMGIESASGGRIEEVERVVLPYDDETLAKAITSPEIEKRLLEQEPVLWLRAVIAAATGRGASEVTNYELAQRHSAGGFAEWDPHVAQAVARYLTDCGFIGLNGVPDRQ